MARQLAFWLMISNMVPGNTLYVGLGASGQPKDQPWRWAKSGVSIIFFLFGCFVFSRIMRIMGPLKRGTFVSMFFIQALLCFISAGLVQSNIVPRNAGQALPDNFIVLLPLALLALTAAGQITASRFLGFGELTTVVVTSAYCDLVFDEKLLTSSLSQNPKRNRRFTAMVLIVLGAVAGGFLTKKGDIAPVLWLSGGLKMVVAGIWAFWKAKGAIRLE